MSAPDVADYTNLVKFLIVPFLDAPDDLKVDCEVHPQKTRVWVRLAFNPADKGRVFGRGGRTIQAIRTVMEAAGQSRGQTLHLEIFGEREHREPKPERGRREGPRRRSSPDGPRDPIQN